ncbi:MBL fold metallo-hydrolase [Breoghania sp. L-A4]|uniref:MBL fold metallo-hydrolase n=1 Tax=Breoghania sp. L-A4 TaxID=2304600 RepID=UPI0013C3566E|nr:MBL fold metallo-hydrolase [Breoghania sp. L-A4]
MDKLVLDRRSLLKLSAVLGLAPSVLVARSTRVQASDAPAHRFSVGDAEITVLSDGHMELPLANLAPDVPIDEVKKAFAEAGLPTNGHTSQVNVSLIRTGDDLILVDTGGGLNFLATLGALVDRMDEADIDPAEITKVVLTHAHPDHVWGIIDDFDESERFPNASYTMCANEWDFWMAEDAASKVPEALYGFVSGAQRNLSPIAEKTERLAPDAEIAPGIHYVPTPGHTIGHCSVLVESGSEQVMITGDALTHQVLAFEHPRWHYGMDQFPDQAVETRLALLDRLATDRIGIVAYHLPWPGVGRVETKGAVWRFAAG